MAVMAIAGSVSRIYQTIDCATNYGGLGDPTQIRKDQVTDYE